MRKLTANALFRISTEFRSGIEQAKQKGLFLRDARMSQFPRGCCDDASDLFAYYLWDNYGVKATRVDGSYYSDAYGFTEWHTWLEVNGVIVDLTADQFPEYNGMYLGSYDKFHSLFEPEKEEYKGFVDLGTDCQDRMQKLYQIITMEFEKM